ncbi:hypothetical protein PN36_33830 [Candidatus Thiomargarita nelsonii]|uniref:Uncharacterized protein n=1 Tax=Candidatus Thiomargarita nelsonii TaxID=1003181 RepID=A0A4E0QQ39_9GAMM|nr:hypothetical protein PN36_33830 [Candidatus Thiomargarita nelsonii]
MLSLFKIEIANELFFFINKVTGLVMGWIVHKKIDNYFHPEYAEQKCPLMNKCCSKKWGL